MCTGKIWISLDIMIKSNQSLHFAFKEHLRACGLFHADRNRTEQKELYFRPLTGGIFGNKHLIGKTPISLGNLTLTK